MIYVNTISVPPLFIQTQSATLYARVYTTENMFINFRDVPINVMRDSPRKKAIMPPTSAMNWRAGCGRFSITENKKQKTVKYD